METFLFAIAMITVGAIIGAIVVNYFSPQWIVRLLQISVRRNAGLTCKSVDVDGFKNWRYLEAGQGNAQTLILIHGFSSNKDGWVHYPAFFKDYHVIIPDVPGFGDHDRDINLDTDTHLQAERLHQFLTAIGVDDACHFIGSSMGGLITIRYALLYPQLVKTLALMNSAGVKLLPDEEMLSKIENIPSPFLLDNIEDANRFINWVFHKPTKLPDFMKRAMYKEAKRDREILGKQYKKLGMDILRNPVNPVLKNLSMPTLILWGRHDQVVGVASTEVLAEEIADNQLEIYETIGHLPMMESPKLAAESHRAFLQSRP